MGTNNKYLFFVSSGRTGTLFLKDFFQNYVEKCSSYHEPKPAFKRRGFELVSRSPTMYEKFYFKAFRELRFMKDGGQHYIEANNCLFSSIPLIREVYPDSIIVHIIRDGRDVVKSYINSNKRYIGNETVLKPSHFSEDPFLEDWELMSPLQKTAWYWLRSNEVIERNNPDQTIYFEELFSPPHEPMKELLSLFPNVNLSKESFISAFAKKKHASKIQFIPDWPEWPSLWKKQFAKICGDKMEEYGYDLN